jgi:hypothetical protein
MADLLIVGAGSIGVAAARAALEDGVVLGFSGVVDPDPVARAAGAATLDTAGFVSTLEVPLAKEGDRALLVFSSLVDDVAPEILRLTSAGYHVVSTCEELAWPPRHVWEAMHTAARSTRRVIIMTGANPGFVMDRLALLTAAASRQLKSVTVRRRVDSATRRDTFLPKTGHGLDRVGFESAVDDGAVGHRGIMASARLLAHTLGWPTNDVTQAIEPLMGEDGAVTGFHQAVLLRADSRTIDMALTIGWHLPDPGDSIVVEGEPPIRLEIPGGYHGDQGAIAQILSALRRCAELEPSFYRPTDLPLRFG